MFKPCLTNFIARNFYKHMKILLTGVTGYIGKRLLIQLLGEPHQVVCCVRDRFRFNALAYAETKGSLEVIEIDFTNKESLAAVPKDIDAAYYLIHSMSDATGDFEEAEKKSAENFKHCIEQTSCRQVIYLTGLVNEHKTSKHLASRKMVEDILQSQVYALTSLRAGIIVGSGSASFEIIRDLAEKLPVMITPKWINTRSQPIAVRNVIQFMVGVLGRQDCYNQVFDIGGTDVLTYKQMLLQYAAVRKLKRYIWSLPVMTPRLSSYWLYFITSTSFPLAQNLVQSMKVDVIVRPNDLAQRLGISLLSYRQAIELAFDKIKQDDVMSTWHDSFTESFHRRRIANFINIPNDGCFKDKRSSPVSQETATLKKIFSIGGSSGWYYGNFFWMIRGLADRMVGGVGLRRGRRHAHTLEPGDPVDFWRVLYASTEEKRLLLFAEMKLPGEAWLEFEIKDGMLYQTATFRPLGLAGRLYWWAVWPFHGFIFNGMLRKLCE